MQLDFITYPIVQEEKENWKGNQNNYNQSNVNTNGSIQGGKVMSKSVDRQ